MFASFKGFASPLRRGMASGACDFGTHQIWWDVEAATEDEALSWLPPYVAERTTAIRVRDLRTP